MPFAWPDYEPPPFHKRVWDRFCYVWNDWLGVVVFIFLALGAFFGIAIWVGMMLDKTACQTKADAMGFFWTWSPMQDCLISVDGGMIPIDAYKVVKNADPR
jgi:hypothetical protein